MTWAIRFDHLIREGKVADYAELSRLGQVSPARMTQIMKLLKLAPKILEVFLFYHVQSRGVIQWLRELRDVIEVDHRGATIRLDQLKSLALWQAS